MYDTHLSVVLYLNNIKNYGSIAAYIENKQIISSGIYFYHLTLESGIVLTRKMMLIK